jgi:hypothetical protein
MTGATYIKREYGPVPRQLSESLRRLESRGALRVRHVTHPLGNAMTQYLALDTPSLAGFATDEISLVDEIIQTICDEHTAESISRASHHYAWKVAEIGEVLPYEAIFVSRFAEIDEDAVSWARAEIEAYERRQRAHA